MGCQVVSRGYVAQMGRSGLAGERAWQWSRSASKHVVQRAAFVESSRADTMSTGTGTTTIPRALRGAHRQDGGRCAEYQAGSRIWA